MTTDRDVKRDFSNIYKEREVPENFLNREKKNRYHITNVDLNKGSISKGEIIDEITTINPGFERKDVAKVIDDFYNIMEREIIFNGRFRITGIVDIYSDLWNTKRDKIEKVPHLEDTYICPPTTVRLRTKLNKQLKTDYRWARRYEESLSLRIEPEDWYKPFIIETPQWVYDLIKGREKYLEEKFNKK